MSLNTNNWPVRMLVVDDDPIFRERLAKALEFRGIRGFTAANVEEGLSIAREVRPHRAVVDLRMPGGSGLVLVRELVALDKDIQVLVLTGYGSIATAVEALKLGAIDYMTKPADAEQILAAFHRDPEHQTLPEPPGSAPSLARVEWEHIQRTLGECDGNISAAARRLGIHRRSLQRKLAKLPPLA